MKAFEGVHRPFLGLCVFFLSGAHYSQDRHMSSSPAGGEELVRTCSDGWQTCCRAPWSEDRYPQLRYSFSSLVPCLGRRSMMEGRQVQDGGAAILSWVVSSSGD